jgi:hypothetical protein
MPTNVDILEAPAPTLSELKAIAKNLSMIIAKVDGEYQVKPSIELMAGTMYEGHDRGQFTYYTTDAIDAAQTMAKEHCWWIRARAGLKVSR